MTNRMMSLLQRAARIRGMIEVRSRSTETSALQLLRLKRLSLLIGQRLEDCLAAVVPPEREVALARVTSRLRRDRRA
ncbi:MAG: hypothetical protein JXA57_13975 [Armatimonadetes bacterium]|nr:hypothetical protein [Armatimonadota bacterium]